LSQEKSGNPGFYCQMERNSLHTYFLSNELPNRTSETIKDRSFLVAKIFLLSLKRSSF
jgi:hypothetical protein